MSTQRTIGDFADAPSAEPEPKWQPTTDDGGVDDARACSNCGAAVSESFRRVFSGNDGEVHACTACASGAQIRDGAVADPSYDLDADVAERRTINADGTAPAGGAR